MYIWVVLAAFVASIYAFNLHYREDIGDVVNTPQAEAVVSKVVIQHKATGKYFDENPMFFGIDDPSYTPDPAVPVVTMPSGDVGLTFSGADLTPYAPLGFNFDDANIISRVFCTDDTDPNKGTPKPCMDAIGVNGFFITYMQIPQRWLASNSAGDNLPSNNLLTAIKHLMGTNSMFGYNIPADNSTMVPNTDWSSDYEIRSLSGRSYLPEIVVADPDFASECLSGTPCIIQLTLEFNKK